MLEDLQRMSGHIKNGCSFHFKTYHSSSCGNVISKEPTSLHLHVGIVDEAVNLINECGKIQAASIFKGEQVVLSQVLMESRKDSSTLLFPFRTMIASVVCSSRFCAFCRWKDEDVCRG